MLTKPRIVRTFHSDIKSCKDYYLSDRDMCIICCDEKFGLAEKLGNGRLDILIDCQYDYIDPFCYGYCYSNAVGVVLNGKWGLYVFKYTVNYKSRKIDCVQISECEFDNINVGKNSEIFVLNKKDSCRYYNLNTNSLSEKCEGILFEDKDCLGCYAENITRWVDDYTDTIIYSTESLTFPEILSRDVYLFAEYDFDGENLIYSNINSNLVFFNRNLRVSYVIEDIRNLTVTRNGFESFEENIVFLFGKDDKKYIITVNNDEWNIEDIKEISKEVEYM